MTTDRNTFSSINLQLFLADLDRWLVQWLDAIPADRGAKPQDVFFDRGRLSELRAIRTMVFATKNESSI